VELPFNSQDVTTVMTILGDIKEDVRTIRELLDQDDGEEQNPEDDA
jgi:hypothetical protein